MMLQERKKCRFLMQRGVALVTALLVVALATVAAVSMATRLHIDLRRAGNLLHGEQAYAYALAAESWGQVILKRDAADNQTDSLQDDWATSLPPIAVEGGLVDGQINDLQGRFNVNNLVQDSGVLDQASLDYFQRLLDRLNLDVAIAPALADWIDSNIDVTLGGAEDEAYLLLNPPYRAANRRLVDISELRLVQGFTPEVISKLAPHITALPGTTTINVNTATLEVLLALDPVLDAAGVGEVVAGREDRGPYETVDDFLAEEAFSGVNPAVPLGVDSKFFQLLTDVVVGGGRARLNSLLHRATEDVQVIKRTRARHFLLPPQVEG